MMLAMLSLCSLVIVSALHSLETLAQAIEKLQAREAEAFVVLNPSVLSPVALEEIHGAGYGVHFYIGWNETDISKYEALKSVVSAFEGKLKWAVEADFNNRGAYVSALPLSSIKTSFTAPLSESSSEFSSAEDLQKELAAFLSFARERLDERLTKDRHRTVAVRDPHFFDVSIYDIFLTEAPEMFHGNPTSIRDRQLHIALSPEKWEALSRHNAESGDSQEFRKLLVQLKDRYTVIRVSRAEAQAIKDYVGLPNQNVEDNELKQAYQVLGAVMGSASEAGLGVVFRPRD